MTRINPSPPLLNQIIKTTAELINADKKTDHGIFHKILVIFQSCTERGRINIALNYIEERLAFWESKGSKSELAKKDAPKELRQYTWYMNDLKQAGTNTRRVAQLSNRISTLTSEIAEAAGPRKTVRKGYLPSIPEE